MTVKRLARLGLLLAMALVLGYAEQFFPILPTVPGIKLGLGNMVILFLLYTDGVKAAGITMLAKVTLCAALFAGFSGFLYSFAGGVLSLAVMWLLSRVRGVSPIGAAIGGAAAHNIGQLSVAAWVLQTKVLIVYLPILMVSAVITGTVTGILTKLLLHNKEVLHFD